MIKRGVRELVECLVCTYTVAISSLTFVVSTAWSFEPRREKTGLRGFRPD